MPYINVKITDKGVTKRQKDQLIAGITDLLQLTLQKKPEYTTVVIEEIPPQNWGVGGINYQDKMPNKYEEKHDEHRLPSGSRTN